MHKAYLKHFLFQLLKNMYVKHLRNKAYGEWTNFLARYLVKLFFKLFLSHLQKGVYSK